MHNHANYTNDVNATSDVNAASYTYATTDAKASSDESCISASSDVSNITQKLLLRNCNERVNHLTPTTQQLATMNCFSFRVRHLQRGAPAQPVRPDHPLQLPLLRGRGGGHGRKEGHRDPVVVRRRLRPHPVSPPASVMFLIFKGHCSTLVEPTPLNQEVVGLNPARCWAYFFSYFPSPVECS